MLTVCTRIAQTVLAFAAVPLFTVTATATQVFEFQSNFFTSNATGPATGFLELPDNLGSADTATASDVVRFNLTHSFDLSTTITFDTAEGDSLTVSSFSPILISDDGLGIDGGSVTMFDGDTGARLRLIFNTGDLNDNYVVDSGNTSDGAFGGAFGGFVLIPEPATAGLLAIGSLCLARRRS